MDETKNKKESFLNKVDNFFHKYQKTIIILSSIFFLVFVAILILIIYYTKKSINLSSELNTIQESNVEKIVSEKVNVQFFPSFTEKNIINENDVFTEEVPINNDFFVDYEEVEEKRTETITPLELRPVAGFTLVNSKITIKNFIENKPKSCLQKVEIAKKDEVSENVNNIQKTLKSWPGIKEQELTGKLDEKTRNNLYLIQKRYAKIIYQNSKNKEPSRIVDKETAHFINILCEFEKEADNEFVYIPVVRYVLRNGGEVIEFNTKTKEKVKYKINTEVSPEEVFFSNDGNYVIYRWEDEKGIIKTHILNIKNGSSYELIDGIETIAWSPDNKIAYGIKVNDNLTIYKHDIFAEKSEFLTSIPLTEWFIEFIDTNNLRITNKPSALTEGISMTLDIKNKKFIQDISPMIGLNTKTLSSKKFTLVGRGGVGNANLLLLNNESKNLSSLGIDSIVDKCSKNILKNGIFCAVPDLINRINLYPDDFYKEKIHTNDKIVYINFEGGKIINIASLADKKISVKELQVIPTGIYLQDSKNLGLYIIGVK